MWDILWLLVWCDTTWTHKWLASALSCFFSWDTYLRFRHGRSHWCGLSPTPFRAILVITRWDWHLHLQEMMSYTKRKMGLGVEVREIFCENMSQPIVGVCDFLYLKIHWKCPVIYIFWCGLLCILSNEKMFPISSRWMGMYVGSSTTATNPTTLFRSRQEDTVLAENQRIIRS